MASQILIPEETPGIVPYNDRDLQLFVDGNVAIKVAPLLRQVSRDLRAKSASLRSRNAEVMNHATEVAVKYYDLNFREL